MYAGRVEVAPGTVIAGKYRLVQRIGEGAMIVYERDGAPLADNEGPLALVSLKDLRPGPRHVKWLQSIELRVLAD